MAQAQSGHPAIFFATNATLTGEETIRPRVAGPAQTGYSPATNGNATNITYIQNPGVFFIQGNAMTSTRLPPGDEESSGQLQLRMKLMF
jgi:hypothetical protein